MMKEDVSMKKMSMTQAASVNGGAAYSCKVCWKGFNTYAQAFAHVLTKHVYQWLSPLAKAIKVC